MMDEPRRLSRRPLFLLLLALAAGALARTPAAAAPAERGVDAGRILAHIDYLASDALAGRRGGTPDEARAAEYIAARFAEYGLEPGYGEDYIRDFPLVDFVVYDRTLAAELLLAGLTPLDCSAPEVCEGPTVSCGWGLAAGGRDDFEGLDLEGAVAVMRAGTPPDWDGPPDAALPAARVLAAQERGASGAILLYDLDAPPLSTGVLTGSQYRWYRRIARGLSLFRNQLVKFLGTYKLGGLDPMVMLMANGGLREMLPVLRSPGDFRRMEKLPKPLPATPWDLRRAVRIPALAATLADTSVLSDGLEVRLDIGMRRERVVSRNVAGVLPHSRKKGGDETIVVGAHFDHIGRTQPPSIGLLRRLAPRKDYIWNGADDNASGTAAMLETARVFAGKHGRRRRDLVFVAFGSEEYGLLGSKAYVRDPARPLDRTIGMLNMDMVGCNEGAPLEVAGAGSGEGLRDMVEHANGKLEQPFVLSHTDLMLSRSDQANFLERRIPSVFLSTGLHPDYHEASDEPDIIVPDRIRRVTVLAVALVKRWRKAKKAPHWAEDFGW